MSESGKFERIQQTTEVAAVEDMESYWRYMENNHKLLKKSAGQLQELLDERVKERDQLKRELQELLQESDDRPIATLETSHIESHFKVRVKELEENEQYLTRLQEVVMNATNCIAKIAHSLDNSRREVTPETVTETMEFCVTKMTAMCNAVDKINLANEESAKDMGWGWSGTMTRSDISTSQT